MRSFHTKKEQMSKWTTTECILHSCRLSRICVWHMLCFIYRAAKRHVDLRWGTAEAHRNDGHQQKRPDNMHSEPFGSLGNTHNINKSIVMYIWMQVAKILPLATRWTWHLESGIWPYQQLVQLQSHDIDRLFGVYTCSNMPALAEARLKWVLTNTWWFGCGSNFFDVYCTVHLADIKIFGCVHFRFGAYQYTTSIGDPLMWRAPWPADF